MELVIAFTVIIIIFLLGTQLIHGRGGKNVQTYVKLLINDELISGGDISVICRNVVIDKIKPLYDDVDDEEYSGIYHLMAVLYSDYSEKTYSVLLDDLSSESIHAGINHILKRKSQDFKRNMSEDIH